MRFAVVGFVTLALLAACATEVTTERFREQATGGTIVVTENDGDPYRDSPDAVPAEPVATVEPTLVPDATEAVESTESAEVVQDNDGLFPTVVAARAKISDGTTWQVDVTLLSEYDSPARYADAWRVLDGDDGDDTELGIRVLAHDHAGEQPFTRSASVEIPAELDVVFIEGRDQLNGWSGERFALTLNR